MVVGGPPWTAGQERDGSWVEEGGGGAWGGGSSSAARRSGVPGGGVKGVVGNAGEEEGGQWVGEHDRRTCCQDSPR